VSKENHTHSSSFASISSKHELNVYHDGSRCTFKPSYECPRFQGCCLELNLTFDLAREMPGIRYYDDKKGQGESFEQLVIFHQSDWSWCASTSLQAAGMQWRAKPGTKVSWSKCLIPTLFFLFYRKKHECFPVHLFVRWVVMITNWRSPSFHSHAFKSTKSICLLSRNENHESISFISTHHC